MLKKSIFLIVTFCALFSFYAQAQMNNKDIVITTFKSKGEVKLVITGNNLDKISEVIIQRGTDPTQPLRQIRILTTKEIEQLKNAPLTWVDKFPLSGATDAFYRAAVTYKEGYQRIFPAIETKIDSTYIK